MENKKTNRNTRLIILAVILALVVLLMCIGGSTLARYITSKKANVNQATIAKWGFVVTVDTKNLFADNYKDGKKVASGTEGIDVSAKKVTIAPNTSGSMTISVNGSAEVLATLNLKVGEKTSHVGIKGTAEGSVEYRPIKWDLLDSENHSVLGEDNDGTLEGALTAINNYFTTADAVIAPNQTVTDKSYTLTWTWALDQEAGDNGIAGANRMDTLLSYAAQGAGNYEGGNVTVTAADGVATITDNALATDEADKVTYTATTAISFDLTLSVMQIQNSDIPVTPAP